MTFLFHEHVFGPIRSRRLGSSLGINLLSTEYKVCNFNCVYCECGWTLPGQFGPDRFAVSDLLLKRLEGRLKELADNPPDAITFAGNGEPTLHPEFGKIAREIVRLRDTYATNAQVVLLSNGTTIHKRSIREALRKIDRIVVKLDAGDEPSLKVLDKPLGSFSLDKLVDKLTTSDLNITIQTMFVAGEIEGKHFDNSADPAVDKWLHLIRRIKPDEVMIYSIDRDTPMSGLQKIPAERLLEIASLVKAMGISVMVS